MKRLGIMLFITLLMIPVLLFSTGQKEKAAEKKIVRVAEQVPGLITPGVWDGQAFSLNSSIYEYLADIDAESGELVPVLASSWSTDDGKIWTIKLNQGVTFHNGSAFSSEDVKFTIERTQNPAIGHLKKEDFAVVSSVETPDPFTVIIHLSESRPTFIYQFTDYNMAILSAHYDYDTLGESKPMGTGPFILEQMIPKESAVLVKNENYWQKGLPYLDNIYIYFVADIDASLSMLEDDRVDVVPFLTPTHQSILEGREGISVVSPYQEQRFISMAVDEKPFDDNRVRLAFKYAMDPEMIALSVARMPLGDGVYYNETPIMNSLAEYKERPLRSHDVEKAKQLLTEAGYPNGVTVPLYYASDHPFGKELSQTLKELAQQAGFTLELKGYTRDVYLAQYWLNVPLSITGWGGRIDPSMLLALAFKSDGSWNESHLKDATVDTLIDAISSEVDPDKRTEFYHQLQDWFYENGALINVQVPYLVALNDRVLHYKQPLTMLPQYKYMDLK